MSYDTLRLRNCSRYIYSKTSFQNSCRKIRCSHSQGSTSNFVCDSDKFVSTHNIPTNVLPKLNEMTLRNLSVHDESTWTAFWRSQLTRFLLSLSIIKCIQIAFQSCNCHLTHTPINHICSQTDGTHKKFGKADSYF